MGACIFVKVLSSLPVSRAISRVSYLKIYNAYQCPWWPSNSPWSKSACRDTSGPWSGCEVGTRLVPGVDVRGGNVWSLESLWSAGGDTSGPWSGCEVETHLVPSVDVKGDTSGPWSRCESEGREKGQHTSCGDRGRMRREVVAKINPRHVVCCTAATNAKCSLVAKRECLKVGGL